MKILCLNLLAFGPFTDTVLDLGDGQEGLHIIYGPNEAGKSSALRALRQMLYGIPARSADDFIHPYGKLRIGGTLRQSNGTVLEFIRRKGRVNTLRGPDDSEVIDESRLRTFLGGVDEAYFSTMLGIDHPNLVRGGEEIVRGGGSIGQILFAAGSGIADFRKVRNDLRAEADDLFKPSAYKPRVNAAISDLRKTRKAIRDAQLPGSEWTRHDTALREAEGRRQEIEEELARKEQEHNRLERIREALPDIARRRELQPEHREVADAVLLPDDFPERRRQASEALNLARHRESEALQNSEEIRQHFSALHVPRNLIEKEHIIGGLFQESGSIPKAAKGRIGLEAQRSSLRADATEILRGLRDDMTLDQAGALRLKKKEEEQIQELSRQHERLITRMESTQAETDRLTLHIRQLEERLGQMEIPPDTTELQQVIEAVRQHGNLEARYQEQCAEIHKLGTALKVALEKLPLWNGTDEALETLCLPLPETIDAFEEQLKRAEECVMNCRADSERLERTISETREQIRELSLTGEVPTESDLQAARNRRDQGWHMIRRMLETGRCDQRAAEAFVTGFPSSGSLADAYEQGTRLADELSDRIRREADRVARKAALLARHEKNEQEYRQLRDQLKAAETKYAEVWQEWFALWTDTGISPRSPREMRTWVQKQSAIAEQFEKLRNLQIRADHLENRIEDCRREVGQSLRALGHAEPAPDKSLPRLIVRARQVAEGFNQARTRREQISAKLEEQRAELQKTQARSDKTGQEIIRWREQWAKALEPLGLDADASPAQANVVMADFKSLSDRLRQAEMLDRQIRDIDRHIQLFDEKVRDLITREAPELDHLSSEQAVAELNALLIRALKAKTEQAGLEKRLRQAENALRNARQDMAEIHVRLDNMCREAGISAYDDFPRAEARSVRRRQIEAEISQTDARLRKLSAGASLEDFIREAGSVDPDTISPQMARLTEEIRQLQMQRTELDQTIGSERNELKRMDGSARAAELAEEAQGILARLEADVEQYVRLRVASVVLNQAIERYREKNQDPILTRSGELFAHMTLGAFEGVRTDFDGEKNEFVLAGVRPGGREILHVSGMSDGTADQLYLAIRLATLMAYLKKNTPMPFIVDDILINFDDRRAVATLQVLAGLARQTQVIFFTHHRHLVELAEKHVEPDVLFTHTLK